MSLEHLKSRNKAFDYTKVYPSCCDPSGLSTMVLFVFYSFNVSKYGIRMLPKILNSLTEKYCLCLFESVWVCVGKRKRIDYCLCKNKIKRNCKKPTASLSTLGPSAKSRAPNCKKIRVPNFSNF